MRLYGADRRAHRARAARRRPRLLLAGRPATAPARRSQHLDLGDGPVLLFVGRIQPLKGLDVAVRALAALRRPDAAARRGRRGQRRRGRRRGRADRQARRRARRRRPGPLRRAAAAPPAVHLLPGRRRRARAEPVGVVRAGRPRGGRVRHPRRGGRGRRAAHARRARPHRLPGRAAAIRPCSPSYAEQVLDSPALAAELSRQAARRAPRLHLVDRRRSAAARLRRPHRPRRSSTAR